MREPHPYRLTQIRDAVTAYVRTTPGGAGALLTDPVFRMQAEMLRRILAGVDAQLEADGVSQRTRDRAYRAVMFGDPDVDPFMYRRYDDLPELLEALRIPSVLDAVAEQRDAVVTELIRERGGVEVALHEHRVEGVDRA